MGSATNDGKEIHNDTPEKLINRKTFDWTECDGCELQRICHKTQTLVYLSHDSLIMSPYNIFSRRSTLPSQKIQVF